MGRRSDHSREDLREMILSAAEGIISEFGGTGLTARRIAHQIGYSLGTLYNLFENMDDLIIHVNARTLDALYGVCVRVPRRETPEDTLRAYAKAYVRFTEKHQRQWAMLLSDRSPPLPNLPEWYQLKVSRLLALVGDALAPLFRDDQQSERLRAARVLWGSIHGISSLASIRALTGKSSDLTNDLITTYVLGLRKSRRAPAP
jgi:AcrR family transcriptional regulator